MSNTKTIRQWLEELPEPYRTQALANAIPKNNLESPSFTAALNSWVWAGSPEGKEYWLQVEQHVLFGTPLPKPFLSQTEPPTNALSALHAIALKKGFPVEDIMSVQPAHEANGWIYTLVATWPEEHFINLSNEQP